MTVTLQQLKPAQITPHKNNPRGALGDLDELAASIAEKGILEPLIVAPNGKPDTYTLLAGHRRLAAAKQAKQKTVPCIVRDDLTDPAAQLETMLVENLQRTDLTPVEEAAAYQQLLEFPGYTVKRIATSTGRSQATVKARLGLAKLPDKVRDKVHRGQISLTDAQALVEFADEPDVVARLERALGTSNFNWYLQQARDDRARRKAEEALVKTLRKDGVRMPTEEELDDILDAWAEKNPNTDVDGYVTVGPKDDVETELAKDPAEHATCPGHAARIVQRWDRGKARPVVEYLCTRPDLHPELLEQADPDDPDNPARAQERAARAEQQKRDAEQQMLKAQLATAAKVRRRHLGQFAASPEAPTVAVQILIDRITDGWRPGSVSAGVLTDVLFPDSDREASRAEAREELLRLPLHTLAVLLDVYDGVDDEFRLGCEPRAWGPRDGVVAPYWQPHKNTEEWRRRLVDVYGYELSDIEAELNAPPAVVDVHLPDNDVTAAEDDADLEDGGDVDEDGADQ